MLVLSRKNGESVVILVNGERIVVTQVEIRNGKSRIGFEASKEVEIIRSEMEDEWIPRKDR